MMKNGAVKVKRHPDIKVAYVTMVSMCHSGEASLTFGHANAIFSVFIDGIRNQFIRK